MKPKQDAFGQGVYDFYQGERVIEIVGGTGWHIAQIFWADGGVGYTAVLQKSAE